MRIRKNAPRVVEGKTSYLICQLNRTPWDDDSFFNQGFWDNDLPLNNSSDDSIPASDSNPSGDSMELSLEDLENSHSPENGGDGDEIGGRDGTPAMLPPGPPPLPPKKVAVSPPLATTASTFPKKRGRPRKPVHAVSPGNNNRNSNSNSNGNSNNNNFDNGNPYQFYYYSGFGPSWGKRRGGTRFGPDPSNCNGNGNDNGNDTPGCSSTTRESNMSEDDEIIIMDDDENKGSNKSVIESFDSVLAAKRELDYIDDEEDEDEDEDLLYGGKRARKPIKARSLKSLM
ncbi:hypothetical protein RND81_02G124700 [Saponaria officinalis]|uniref:Uncharacterized protein n=1 Tax=Saponaria officinalis TaxID=3572 RepID=A0AAW1MTX8_SAPOF